MNWIIEILTSYYFLSFFLAWIISCILKAATTSYRKNKKFTLKYGFENGGMPSSHTASVVSVVVAIGIVQQLNLGYFNGTFYIALVFALIVISDAFGVRQYIGKQGDILNKLLKGMKKDPLKVVYGHTFLQVIGGIILGVLVPTVLYLLFF